jgi:dolichol kinase
MFAMQIEWGAALLFLSIFLLLTTIAHLLHKKAGMPAEFSRKFLHVSGGILSLFAVLFFRSHLTVMVICSLAFLFLLFTYAKHWLPAVHQTKRRSVGSIIFPIPVYLCFLAARLLSSDMYFLLPIAFLTFSDTVAEWTGRKWGKRTKQFFNGQKTLAGSAGFFLCSVLIAAVLAYYFGVELKPGVVLVISTSLFATVAELVSTNGYDNLTVPFTALLFVYLSQLIAFVI